MSLRFKVSAIKKTANISTVRATAKEKAKLQQAVKALGFRTIAHFFTQAMETFLEQLDAGEQLRWPLRFETLQKNNPQVMNLRFKPVSR